MAFAVLCNECRIRTLWQHLRYDFFYNVINFKEKATAILHRTRKRSVGVVEAEGGVRLQSCSLLGQGSTRLEWSAVLADDAGARMRSASLAKAEFHTKQKQKATPCHGGDGGLDVQWFGSFGFRQPVLNNCRLTWA